MVKSALKDSPFLLYDLVGATLVLGLVLAGSWSSFVHLPDSRDRFSQNRVGLADLRQSLRRVEANLRDSNTELSLVKAEVKDRGALPESSPVDANLQTITRLIQKNQIELINVNPVDEKQYPGLTELNYKIQCRSGFDAMLRFLGDFEAEPFWADLTSLKILGATNPTGLENPRHKTEFIVSLFAAQSVKDSGSAP